MCQRSHQMGEGGREPGAIEPREHGRRIVLTSARHVALGKLHEVDRRERLGPPQTVLPCSRSRMVLLCRILVPPDDVAANHAALLLVTDADRGAVPGTADLHPRRAPQAAEKPLEVSRSSGTCAACIRRTFGCRSSKTTLVLAQAVTRRTAAAPHVVGCR